MQVLSDIIQVLFPSTCACCGQVLVRGERQVCLACLMDMAPTLYSPMRDNAVERLLTGRFRFENATAIYRFGQDNTVRRMVHAMKFHGNSDLCLLMGRQMGMELLRSARFDDVDLLLPVPLHWARRLRRGYNQSELLCRGIADVMSRPVNTTAVVRHRYTRQQSLQRGEVRSVNVEGAFWVRRPAEVAGKHVLLVDDVLTTGATVSACAEALSVVPGVRISVAVFSTVLG